MASFFIDDGSGSPRPIRLGNIIAQGAVGTIHHVSGEPGIVAKLYKKPDNLNEYEEKIAAMLAAPPQLPAISYHGRTYVQIAWPTARIIDGVGFRGFVMPEVDFRDSTELENILQKSVRQRKHLPEFYGTRVLLAANLSALTTQLHALGHYMVDMKPMNMRFYPQAWYMAILDTDGFSINGKRRLPARQFSDEYIAPESQGKRPEQLGLHQDLFALAVIIFRLLNNGIHPYQGIDAGGYPTTLQERIFADLYAYGITGHHGVKPALSSVHEYLEDGTRTLFDRAFHASGTRPAAAEWRDHLNGLISDKVLVKCATDPTNHGHFSKGCGFCALERHLAGVRTAAARAPILTRRPVQSSERVLRTLQTASGGIPASSSGGHPNPIRPSRIQVFLITILFLVLGASYILDTKPRPNSPTPMPTIAPRETPPQPATDTSVNRTLTSAKQKAVLYEEDKSNPSGRQFVGTAVWRTDEVAPNPDQKAEAAIQADIEIPEQKITVRFSLRRNDDRQLQASHTVEIVLTLPPDFPHGSVTTIPGILMKQGESARGVPLRGVATKVSANFFLLGLTSVDADMKSNIQLLKERPWFDVPIVYGDGTRAIVAFEKGTSGSRAFADAFAAWNQ
jgi:hypothetical protein